MSDPWAGLEGRPLAAATGPFPGGPFLSVWWRHFGAGEPLVVAEAGCTLGLVRRGDAVSFAGDPEVTDYHSPLGPNPEPAVQALAAGIGPGVSISLDSLPAEAASALDDALRRAGLASTGPVRHEAAMVIDDAATYPGLLPAKQRHEVRRKRRRFEESVGPPSLAREDGEIEAFLAMHRRSPGDKGSFMTPAMAAFFVDLLDTVPGASLQVLRDGAGSVAAAAFGFEDDEAYYLYNSSFDPDLSGTSPGIVLVDALIRDRGECAARRFDFLKGTETYKLRLGARSRPLFRLEVTV